MSATHRSVVAVVSAFAPPRDLADRVTALLAQVDAVVVVDDGTHTVSTWALTDSRVHLHELDENQGIAAALNVGIRLAQGIGATHVLTLDQDSEVPDTYVRDALALLDRLAANHERVAAVVPEQFGATSVVADRHGRPWDPIQSGQVVPVGVFEAVGLFEERFFIDSVDTEFTLRARAAGYEFVMLPGSRIEHALGEVTPIMVGGKQLTLFGKERNLHHHAPFRTYYIVRNGAELWRIHRPGNLWWLFRRTGAMLYSVVVTSVLSPDRGAHAVAVLHGARDAWRGSFGRIPDDTLRQIRRRSGR